MDDEGETNEKRPVSSSWSSRVAVWSSCGCSRAAIVLVLCLLCKLIKSPGQNNVMGSSVPFIVDELGFTDMQFASLFSLGTLVAACVQPFFGLLLDWQGVRVCIPLGLCALAGGMLMLSVTTGPFGLFCSFAVIRATSIGCLEAWPSAALSFWFRRFRGRAMALMMVVGGLPTGTVAAAMQTSDAAIGWRSTLHVVIICLLVHASLCAMFLRNRPPLGEEGQQQQSAKQPPAVELAASKKPDQPETPSTAEPQQAPAAQSWSRRLLPSQRAYTLGVLYCSACLITAVGGGIDLFTVEMARGDAPHGQPTYDVASVVFLPIGVILSISCLVSGALLDHGVPPHRLYAVACILHGATALAATQLGTARGGLLYAVTRGLASGLVAPVVGCVLPHFFGTQQLGRLLGGQSLFFVGGTCLGSLLIGSGPDLFGSFAPMLVMLASRQQLRRAL